jgi:predicted MFS family arabinose efflux permease
VLLNAAPAMPTGLWAGIALLFLGFAAGFMDVCMNTQAVEVERDLGKPILSTLHGICSLGGLAGAASGAAAAYLGLSLSWHMLATSLPLLALVLWARGGLLPPTSMPASLRPRARPGRANGTLLLLGAIGFCSSVGEGAMASWVGVYLHDNLHAPFGTASLGLACFSFTMVLGRITCDRLSERLHPRQLVRASGVLVTLGLTLGLIVNTQWALLAAASAVGLGLAPIIPAIFRTGGRLKDVPPSDALATLATMSYGGQLFGPPTIGMVADHGGLRMGLGVVALLALVLTVLAQWMPRPQLKTLVTAKS